VCYSFFEPASEWTIAIYPESNDWSTLAGQIPIAKQAPFKKITPSLEGTTLWMPVPSILLCTT
jgi:hypothetical protein